MFSPLLTDIGVYMNKEVWWRILESQCVQSVTECRVAGYVRYEFQSAMPPFV